MPQIGQLKDPITATAEVVLGPVLGVPSAAVDVNLFKEQIGKQVVVGGNVTPVQATVLRVMVLCPPTHLHYPPNQL